MKLNIIYGYFAGAKEDIKMGLIIGLLIFAVAWAWVNLKVSGEV